MMALQSWWSYTFNKPLKDPLLQSYTLYELLYEYHNRIYRVKAEQDKLEQDTDKIEDKKIQDALDWAAEEERKEMDEAKKKEAKPQSEEPEITEDDKKWMEEELKKAKTVYGDNFGEDLSMGDGET